MAQFIYEAKKGLNELIKGVIEAENQEIALKKLTTQGLFPTKITPYSQLIKDEPAELQDSKKYSLFFGKRIGTKEILTLTQKLTTLTRAKVELLTSLRILYEQTDHRALKDIVQKIYNYTKEGQSFSESLQEFPKVFTPLFVNIIKSGEVTGRLDEALTQISEYLQQENKIKTKIAVALAYPSLLVLVGTASVFVLLNFVIPKLKGMFLDLGDRLPLLTRIVFDISSFLQDNFLWLVTIACVLTISSFTQKGNYYLKNLARKVRSKIPIVKRIVQLQEMIHFCRSLNLLLASGVPALKSLQIVLQTVEDEEFRNQLNKVCQSVAAGESLARSLDEHAHLPAFLIQMFTIGEESGRLEKVLNEIIASYTEQVEADIAVITSLLEPVLILILGIILGTIVLSILLPIFEITHIVK